MSPRSLLFLIYVGALCAAAQGATILFLSCWQKSPVIALNGLAEELHARGHRVLFATPDEDRYLVSSEAAGIEWISAGPSPASVDYPAHEIQDLWAGEGEFAISMYDHLLPKLSTPQYKPDLIAFDVLAIAGEGLAHALNVPSIALIPHQVEVGIGPGMQPSSSYPSIISGMDTSSMTFGDLLFNSILTTVERYILPVVRGLVQRKARAHMGLPAEYGYKSSAYGRSKLAIVGTIPGAEPPRKLPPSVQLAGPWLPRSFRPCSAELQAYLDASTAPLVFVSIGTNSDWTPASANAMLNALLEGAESGLFRVLWIIKTHHQALLDASTLARAKALPGFRVEPFVEQLAVLSHNNTAVFVTHSGLSSSLESIYYGVPMVFMPMMLVSDQPTNAARFQGLGLGVWADRRKGEVDAASMLSLITTVINNPSYEASAQRWSALMNTLHGRERAGDLIEAALLPLDLTSLLQAPPCCHYELYAIWGSLAALTLFLFSKCCCRGKGKGVAPKAKQN